MDQHPEVAREPREIELKLEIEPGALDAVRRHPRLAGADERTATLRATYFDTPDARLREAGIALRIRDEDGRRVQTVKAMRGPAGLLFDRDEWETEVEGEALDLSAAKGTALEPLLSEERLRRALKPAFTVETRRTTLSIEDGEAVMEVVLDQGEIRAGRRRAPFLEVELELTAGDPRVLFDLAEALAADLPVKVGHLTKSERGYALLRRQPLKAVKAEPVALVPGQSVGEAMQAIARNCLTQLVRNEAVLAAAPQPAAVHQARVALRRFRAAFTLVKDAVADPESLELKQELRWMASVLGEARDLDVFLTETLKPLAEQRPDDPALTELVRRTEARRDEAYDRALSDVASPRFRRDVLQATAWAESGAWLRSRDRDQRRARERPIERHAADELERRTRRLRKRLKHIAELEPEARHEVRIALKKLRYASEFFGELFTGGGARKRRRAALEALEALQDTLGELNDLSVAAGLVAEAPEAAATLKAEAERREAELLAEVAEQGRAFAAAEPYWT